MKFFLDTADLEEIKGGGKLGRSGGRDHQSHAVFPHRRQAG